MPRIAHVIAVTSHSSHPGLDAHEIEEWRVMEHTADAKVAALKKRFETVWVFRYFSADYVGGKP